jgi:hypothetical protein
VGVDRNRESFADERGLADGHGYHAFLMSTSLARWAIPADESGQPRRHHGRGWKSCNIKFSNKRGPTLRTPCGEERSARTSKAEACTTFCSG